MITLEKIRENLSANIKFHRERKGFTQQSLADEVGMSLRGIQQLEYKLRWPSPRNLERVSRALGVTPADLISHPGETYFPEPVVEQFQPAGEIPADLLYFLVRLAKENAKGLEAVRVFSAKILGVPVTSHHSKPGRRTKE